MRLDFIERLGLVTWITGTTMGELAVLNAQAQFISICVAILAGLSVAYRNFRKK